MACLQSLAFLLLLFSVSTSYSFEAEPVRRHNDNAKPNFVLIQTDDQARWDIIAMNKTRRLLADQGVSFLNYMVNTPICCPSRTELVSGRYFHNVGAPNGSCMHVNSEQMVFDANSVFSMLEQSGYSTGVFGKVTNDQGRYFCSQMRADGMTVVSSPCDYNSFFSTKYFVKLANGTKYVEQLDANEQSTYQTSQLGNRSIAFIRDMAKSGKPFYAYIGPHAPHYPANPAPWQEADIFANITAPRTPNWNASCPDHHEMVAQNPPLNDNATIFLDHQHRVRLMSLLAVDDVIEAVYNELQELGILESTYVMFTSDHGYHLGQWRVPSSKQQPYDTDIFVTTFARGPGISAGSSIESMVGNVDVTPTMLDLAGVEIPSVMDGKSLAPLVVTEPNPFWEPVEASRRQKVSATWRDRFLIEYKSVGQYDNKHAHMWWPGPTWKGQIETPPGAPCPTCPHWWLDGPSNTYRGIRILNDTHNMLYAEFNPDWVFDGDSVFYELYDINKDPYQMHNIYNETAASVRKQLHADLGRYASCAGGQGSTPKSCP